MKRLCVSFLAVGTVLTIVAPAQAQAPATTGAAPDIASRSIDKKGLGLTPDQSTMIADATRGEKQQSASTPLSIGAPIPDSMTLVELPIEVKDRIGSLRDFKFARLQNDTVLLVDPTTRTVVDVIRK